MNMCTCLTGRWNADVILRLQQLLQLQAWSNVCRCSAKSLKKTTLFCHSRIGSSPRSSRPFISTFSLNPKPLKRFCKCVFGISQPRKRNSFLFFFLPATLKSDPAGTGQHFLPRCPEDPHHFQIFISYVPDSGGAALASQIALKKRTSNISRNGQI